MLLVVVMGNGEGKKVANKVRINNDIWCQGREQFAHDN
jgi:hypothetical protein